MFWVGFLLAFGIFYIGSTMIGLDTKDWDGFLMKTYTTISIFVVAIDLNSETGLSLGFLSGVAILWILWKFITTLNNHELL